MMTCWGLGPHKAARSALRPSSWPMMSDSDAGRVFSAKGSVKEICLSRLSFSSSLRDSRSTAARLVCCARSRLKKYRPMTTAKKKLPMPNRPIRSIIGARPSPAAMASMPAAEGRQSKRAGNPEVAGSFWQLARRPPQGRGKGAPSGGFFLLLGLALHPQQPRRRALQYASLVDDALVDVVPGRDLVHHVQEQALHDGAQAPGARLALHGLAGDGPQRVLGEFQLYPVHFKELLELLHQGVAGLHQDAHQGVFVQGIQGDHHRQAPDELGDEPVLEQ